MADDLSNDTLEDGIKALKERRDEFDLSNFEQRVWSEIALRDERGLRRWLSRFQAAQIRLQVPVAATLGVVAIAAGSFLGLSQADAYGRESSLALEQRYVESIHPVLMSTHQADQVSSR